MYKSLCKNIGKIFKKFICEIDYKKIILLFEEISKNLLIKVSKRTKKIKLL